ncbi:MAG: hypothetical protein ACP5NQ_08165 [Vulcanisaeta sp.]
MHSIASLSSEKRHLLAEAIDGPDALFTKEGIPLMNKLIRLNLAIKIPQWRDESLWIDQPPPERDLELGIGKYVAWQTPLHREAIKKALQETTQ